MVEHLSFNQLSYPNDPSPILQRYSGWWLSPTPLKNMSSSNGIIVPNIWKNNPNVPNHQPVLK
jgi:hypothetical protein